MTKKFLLVILLLVFYGSSLAVWGQSTYVVDRLTDTGDGSGLRGDLRYCLTNATSGEDVITFEVTGTINLTGALPELTTSVTIEGPGADQLIIRRDTGGNYRIFTLTGTPTVVISGLTITNGRAARGGGIYVGGGALTLTDSILSNHQAVGADGRNGPAGQRGGDGEPGLGGGIYVAVGALEVNASTLTTNQAIGGKGGNVADSFRVLRGGSGGSGAQGGGGGIHVAGGTVSINNTTLSDNRGTGGLGGNGGGAYLSGGSGGSGGPGDGGGIHVAGGTVSINNTTLSDNQGTGGRGGAGYRSLASPLPAGRGGSGGPGDGGGIYVAGGTMTLHQSTLSANRANGGEGGNRGQSPRPAPPSTGGLGAGGGLYLASGVGPVAVRFSTLSANEATGGLGGDDGLGPSGQGEGGGIANRGTLQARNTLLAVNSAANSGPDLSGNLGSLGHNLISDSSDGSGFDETDLLDLDPKLGPLQDNGGPTQTHALLEGSPAIGAGDTTDAPEFDQRGEGFPRIDPVTGLIDIGAFQFQG